MTNVLITGANRGIGLEFVKQMWREGRRVFACCRNPEKTPKLQELAQEAQGDITLHRLDVSNHRDIDELAQQLKDEFIDIVINNAGTFPDNVDGKFRGFGEINYDDWMRAFQINTMAPMKVVEAFIENIKASQDKKVVTISSLMGSIAENHQGGSYLYRSSKAAVNAVIKSLSVDLRPFDITCVALHPGWVATDMGGTQAPLSPEESVQRMCDVISDLTIADTGKFFSYDGLEVLW